MAALGYVDQDGVHQPLDWCDVQDFEDLGDTVDWICDRLRPNWFHALGKAVTPAGPPHFKLKAVTVPATAAVSLSPIWKFTFKSGCVGYYPQIDWIMLEMFNDEF